MGRRRAPVLPDLDDEADAKPKDLSCTDSVERVIRLLEWARKGGYAIGPTVQVGDVIMNVQDLRLARREALRGEKGRQPERTIYQEHGLDDDDEPVDGTVG